MAVVGPTDMFTTHLLGVCKLTRRPISNQKHAPNMEKSLVVVQTGLYNKESNYVIILGNFTKPDINITHQCSLAGNHNLPAFQKKTLLCLVGSSRTLWKR